jgi:hypothetical protein
MPGILYQYLADDHKRLDGLLQRATVKQDAINMESYGEFRMGLLRHIGIEENIILPAIAKLQSGRRAALVQRLNLDHDALIALLIPPPSPSIVLTIKSILKVHNAHEEQEDGLYQLFEQLSGPDTENILELIKAAPEVPVLTHSGKPDVLEATRCAVERAGYEFKTVPVVTK